MLLLLIHLRSKNICNTVDMAFEKRMQLKFNNLFRLCTLNKSAQQYLDCSIFNATLTDTAMSKLNNSKAIGMDKLQKQHLIYAHPILYSTLSNLFYFMFAIFYVPNQFGCGIIIPIQKDTSLKGVQKPDNFRGITVSTSISKVFKYSRPILFLYRNYLPSNDRLFLGLNQTLVVLMQFVQLGM